MKKKMIKIGIVIAVIIIGVTIMALSHFKFDLYYGKNTRVEIYLGKQFDVTEVESKVKEVLKDKKTITEVAGAFSDTISLTTTEITDEEVDAILSKLNETYGTELSKDLDTEIIRNGNIRGRDIYSPYIVLSSIAVILQVIVLATLYRKKIAIPRIILTSIGTAVLGQFLYFIILSITGMEINRMIPASSVAIYIFSMVYLTSQFEKSKEITTK